MSDHRNLKWTLMLHFLGGVLCMTWNVKYQQQHICALKGSPVVLLCSFSYPAKETVQSVKWGHGVNNIYNGPFIYDSESKNTSSRFMYIGDKKENCSIKLLKVEPNDGGKFAFRFTTMSTATKRSDAYTGADGVELKISYLKINVTKRKGSDRVKEGDSLNLTCSHSCHGGKLPSAITWFKDGERIQEGPVLYCRNMSSTNSGNYSCSLKAHEGTSSEVVRIDVEYGPKNTSVSVAPSEEVDAGSKITLNCSSHANPPVENYTWFKMHNNDVTAVGRQPAHHFKEFYQRDEGQYFCSATNAHGSHNSSVVKLKLKVYWAKSRSELIIAASVATLLTATAVIAVRRLCKRRITPPETETDCDVDSQVAEYVNWPMPDTSRSEEESRCEPEAIYAVVVHKRKSDMEQQMDSHDDDDDGECVIYSTVCRTQTSKPSYIEPSRHQTSFWEIVVNT